MNKRGVRSKDKSVGKLDVRTNRWSIRVDIGVN
jgi:hypothetical protein